MAQPGAALGQRDPRPADRGTREGGLDRALDGPLDGVLPSASTAFRNRARELGIDLDSELTVGDIDVDLELYEVRRGSSALELSPRQVELLAVFVAAPGRVFSRDQLHWLCWQDVSPSRRVDVQLCRIRAKVGLELFRNVRDRGWALRPPA